MFGNHTANNAQMMMASAKCLLFLASLIRISFGLQLSNRQAAVSSYLNSSSTVLAHTTRPATLPEHFCCQVAANSVGLNTWWNSSYAYTQATVFTQYLVYDNNVTLTRTKTMSNNHSMEYGTMVDPGFNPSTTVLPGAPTNLIAFDYGGYAGTAVDSGTVWSLGTTAM